MSTATSAWDSLTGRRGVDIGASFTRAWNERIGKTAKRSKDYPNPEYYSLRYNFKPESIDNENAGTLTPKQGRDGRVFELERPSQQTGDNHRFTAVEQPSKEWECVLLWDPDLQQLTLEKLESTLNLHHEGRSAAKGTRPPSATPPSSTPGSSRSKRTPNASAAPSPQISHREIEEDLEKALTGQSDAEGETDEDVELQAEIEAAVGESMKQEEEEEEEDEEMEAVEVAPAPPPPPPAKVKATPKPKPKPRARPSTKRERNDDDIEEEVLTFGEPTKQTKRPRRSSAAYSNSPVGNGLALPAPPPQNHHAPPTPSQLLQPPSSAPIPYVGSDPDSDESDGGQELGDELEAAALELAFEQELELELGEADGEADGDEDEGMEAVPLDISHHDDGRPKSLNELFGDESQNDDDTTSDDSSDDD